MGIAASLMYRSGQTVPALAVFFLPSIVGLCWLVFALVGVWRCAPNADLAVSRIASRVAVVVVVAAAIVQLMPGIEAGQQSIAEQRARAAAEASQGR
jgi:cytochrome bd-type quinol oxidase subunit 1